LEPVSGVAALCVVARDGPEWSSAVAREAAHALLPRARRVVAGECAGALRIDGEIVIARESGLDFDALLQRIHRPIGRVKLLGVLGRFLVLGLRFCWPLRTTTCAASLRIGDGRCSNRCSGRAGRLYTVTPATPDPPWPRDWFARFEGAGLDGVVAKPWGSAIGRASASC